MDKDDKNKATSTYTCRDYRQEMILLSLKKQLKKDDLTPQERKDLKSQILHLEKTIGF